MGTSFLSKAYQFLKKVFSYFVIWFSAFIFWSLLRQFGQELVDGPNIGVGALVLIYLLLGLIAGIAFGTIDTLLPPNFYRHASFGRAVLIRTSIYFVFFILLTILGIAVFSLFDDKALSWSERFRFLLSEEMALLLAYCFIVVFQVHFVKELDKKFGPGNLVKMLLGSFHKPKEEERVFMFLDLKSSTAIAEKLGHLQYSQLIQDCFSDLEAVFAHQAEVYQYVGDEVVLTWKKEKGIRHANCLAAFFSYKKRIQTRADYYQKNYGTIPQFKAGLHVGQIVVAEVGEEKREIAYHGDTINTAARIQSECGKQEEDILTSSALFHLLVQDDHYTFTSKGAVQLKGKASKTEMYAVEERK